MIVCEALGLKGLGGVVGPQDRPSPNHRETISHADVAHRLQRTCVPMG